MSSTAQPIAPGKFAAALRDLTLPSLYAKVAEIRNSIAHLQRSNDEMRPLLDAGDSDFAEHIWDNLAVIRRHEERLELLKHEVEERGYRWDLVGSSGGEDGEMGPGRVSPGPEEEEGEEGTGTMGERGSGESGMGGQQGETRQAQQAETQSRGGRGERGGGGSLDDAELARRLAERTQEDGDGDEGVFL